MLPLTLSNISLDNLPIIPSKSQCILYIPTMVAHRNPQTESVFLPIKPNIQYMQITDPIFNLPFGFPLFILLLRFVFCFYSEFTYSAHFENRTLNLPFPASRSKIIQTTFIIKHNSMQLCNFLQIYLIHFPQ